MNRQEVVDKIKSLKGEEGHKWVVDTYNTIKPLPRGYKIKMSDAWCAATVSAVFHSFGYDDIAECSCARMVDKAKAKGIWIENDAFTPQLGDVIMYDWQDSGKGDNVGNPDHVGIVIDVKANKIVVREGNKKNTLGNRDVLVNGVTIRGYITPPYKAQEEAKPVEPTIKPSAPVKPQEKPQTSSYKVGNVYTVNVRSALNVRKGAGKNYGLVGYNNLTQDAKKHAVKYSSALLNGTKVTCNEVKVIGNETWMRIPSGWICAKSGANTYCK